MARSRWSQSGVRFAGSGRGISRARPAFWRNRRPNRALSPSSSRISASAARRSGRRRGRAAARRSWGRRNRRPSSPCRQATAIPSRSRSRPWSASFRRLVELAAERREHGQAELAGRVAEGLDEDRPVVGDRAGDADLAGDVVAEAPARRRRRAGTRRRARRRATGSSRRVGDLAAERADRLAQLGRPRRALAPPERHQRRLTLGAATTTTLCGSIASIRQVDGARARTSRRPGARGRTPRRARRASGRPRRGRPGTGPVSGIVPPAGQRPAGPSRAGGAAGCGPGPS